MTAELYITVRVIGTFRKETRTAEWREDVPAKRHLWPLKLELRPLTRKLISSIQLVFGVLVVNWRFKHKDYGGIPRGRLRDENLDKVGNLVTSAIVLCNPS